MLKSMQSGPKQPRAGDPGELALLKQIRARAARLSHGIAPGGLRLGIGDDCALLRIGAGEELAVTTDLSISGRHFRLEWQVPESIGHRTLARGVRDLAAMGARPGAAFLSLGVPKELVQNAKGLEPRASKKIWLGKKTWVENTWIGRFFDGFFALASAFQTPLAGGDLAESPLAVADIVLVGAVRRGKALLRSGARPGDLLYVTGALGGAAAGLARLAELAATHAARPGSKRIAPLRISGKLQALLAPHV